MKTTVEISEILLVEAEEAAMQEGTTVSALMQDGLSRVLRGREQPLEFRLRRATFGGKGLQPGAGSGSWESIRGLVYRD